MVTAKKLAGSEKLIYMSLVHMQSLILEREVSNMGKILIYYLFIQKRITVQVNPSRDIMILKDVNTYLKSIKTRKGDTLRQ